MHNPFSKKKEKKKKNIIFVFFCIIVIILTAFFVLYMISGAKPETRIQAKPPVKQEQTGAKKVIVSPSTEEEDEEIIEQSVVSDEEEFDISEETCPPREQAMINGTFAGYDDNYIYISGNKDGEDKIRLNSGTGYVYMLTNEKYELISQKDINISGIKKGESVSVIAIKDNGGEYHAQIVKMIVVQ